MAVNHLVVGSSPTRSESKIEEWLSGLKRRSAKSLYRENLYRGFESLFF